MLIGSIYSRSIRVSTERVLCSYKYVFLGVRLLFVKYLYCSVGLSVENLGYSGESVQKILAVNSCRFTYIYSSR